jgi:dihydrofolate synthase/folylpolyglutamate synthase
MTTLDDLLDGMKQLHPLLIDLSLDRVRRLLAQLGNPQDRLPPVVHIAGTNGKGSTTAFLRAMMEAAGKRVHVYTSPHLVRFNERIVLGSIVGGRPIDEDALVELLERVQAVNAGESITFFEITTAAAFLAFAETHADFLLLEVGLGGRLDTTNVVDKPALTVITPISMDHADKLGDTVEKIAVEKAGIMKRGVLCVTARQTPAVDDVLETEARRHGADLMRWGEHFDAHVQRGRLVFQREDRLLDLPMPALLGPHQIINAGTAVAAALELGLDDRAIAAGLTRARWPARMQLLGPGAVARALGPDGELWLDGGHNPAAGVTIARTMADLEERSPRPLVLIVGMMGQKDAEGFLQPFAGLARHVLTVPIPGAHQPPHMPDALAEAARRVGLDALPATGVIEAVKTAATRVGGPVRVLICGSLYLAGHVLALQDGLETQSN